MNAFVRASYRVLGPYAEARALRQPDLQKRLFRAHHATRAGAWLAALYASAAIAATLALALALALALVLRVPLFVQVVAPPLVGAWVGAVVIAAGPLALRNAAADKARQIDEALPAALNYMLALANAGLPPVEIWGSLARAKVFGPVAFEAERVHRDLSLFSYDILRALRLAQERTPSSAFQEFLQGAISSFQSGVELESYLKQKGAQYQHEAVERQRKLLDTMGVMAEAFLVVVVAAPLFLMILLTVMSINQGRSVILYGMLLTFVFIPMAQLLVGAVIRAMNPQTWT